MLFFLKSRKNLWKGLFLISIALFSLQLQAEGFTHQPEAKSDEQREVKLSQELIRLFFNVNAEISNDELQAYVDELEAFTQKLAKRQYKYRSEKQFLRYAFYKIHNRYMKHYSEHTDLYDLVENGNYDCITGSAFYALILDALDIKYVIRELPYHVFLLVEIEDESSVVLFESTDARNGFITDAGAIKEMMSTYEEDIQPASDVYYNYSFTINEKIELKQLAALNYYNEAIAHYNQQNLKEAEYYLNYARQLYPAKRMEALHYLINQVSNQSAAQMGR
ncbi:hypothetical protein PZB74_14260 [Porifericola rhodea]|uniref:hypothetical protein n=1 Tax=Porifericola rhodea TaxID=930972 RepID=UPI002664EF3B|nr:hypothetical protein [Porifericola rhodea]WKN30125.1 hypothetical protein PZB74_14260 [Porifericola rhodea]